ncbi:MAG: DUF484 family protein [Pseudomonadota bacterium]
MSNDITAEQVAQFLRADPDFFSTHAELLADLKIPHENGSAVSLVERQVTVLRERNVELRERLNGLLSIARDNDVIFEKTRVLVLALLEAQALPAAADALSKSLLGDFSMAAMSLVLFDAALDTTPARVRVQDAADAEARMGSLLKGRRVVCGVLRPEELAWLFGEDAEAVGSAAIVPLVHGRNFGLLAIGARDPQHFRSGMDTLFVGHIGDVLARRLHVLLPDRDASARAAGR